jgi:hypothetical protein
MNRHSKYIRRKETGIFTIFYCIRMPQLSSWSIRQSHNHNVPFMHLSGLCLQSNRHTNDVVNRGERMWYTKERYGHRERMVSDDGFRGNRIDSSTW